MVQRPIPLIESKCASECRQMFLTFEWNSNDTKLKTSMSPWIWWVIYCECDVISTNVRHYMHLRHWLWAFDPTGHEKMCKILHFKISTDSIVFKLFHFHFYSRLYIDLEVSLHFVIFTVVGTIQLTNFVKTVTLYRQLIFRWRPTEVVCAK